MRIGRKRDLATYASSSLGWETAANWMQVQRDVLGSLSLVRRNASREHFGGNGEFLASHAISGTCARD